MKYNDIIKIYFEYFNKEKLPYIKCNKCGNIFYYPRTSCPKCLSDDISIVESQGIGEIYAETKFVNDKGEKVAVGLIKLVEGFNIYANIYADDINKIEIGKKVKVVFKELIKGQKFPFFAII